VTAQVWVPAADEGYVSTEAPAAEQPAAPDRSRRPGVLLVLGVATVLSALAVVSAYSAGAPWQLAGAVPVLLAVLLVALLTDRPVPVASGRRRQVSAVEPNVAPESPVVDHDRLLDPLTKLSSRQTLTLMAAPMIEHARRSGLAVHCLYLDVVELARVNDAHGQVMGDELLVSVAEALTGAVRGTDVVARWGGDEFVVIGPGTGISPLELERRLSSRPCEGEDAPARSIPGSGTALPGDVSVGSATLVPWDDGGLDSLLRRAEQDMALRRSLRQQAKQRPAALGEAARRARDTPA
jgi:diguanylate cyclase (GGDEF)-like protein